MEMEEKNNDCNGCGQPIENNDHVIISNSNVAKLGGCQGCSGNKFSGKLGTCVQCMLTASFGTVFGWLAYLILFFLGHEKNVQFSALLVATFFTLILIAHGIAYFIKRSSKKK